MKRVNSILLVDKKEGLTSFQSLNLIKKNIDKKVGHCGTLDKFASGLMIVLTNRYTKLNSIFSNKDKEYEALFEFGIETDTLDPEGKIIKEGKAPTLKDIENAIKNNLTGKILQEPPIYSAIHVNGERAYKLARNNKITKMDKRECFIHKFDIIEYNKPFLKSKIKVSKGTYIRSIARDLGKLTNSCAYVKSLRRTKIGNYSIKDAIDISNTDLDLEKHTRFVLSKIEGLKTYNLNDYEDSKIKNGHLPNLLSKKGLYKLVYDNKIRAIVNDFKLMVLLFDD